ncbi:hypothetical protein DP113_13135 [Brasilonema octagenarum UFV-E1]|uniref:Uncharacterized protein n=2 Tax=Brasilonema TaxID=383614 RepID=A0A856MDD4_9CYAN|nr:hypothetical protein [Brasilonema octagenarum UFV-OR1]QDL08718.1 hypothetical protein DP114_13195 [Brasilonema sennae CENA114]QDL15074.1 hypothetical protein DP113_13135 [Brasilonema octagenarum UFV-E1]
MISIPGLLFFQLLLLDNKLVVEQVFSTYSGLRLDKIQKYRCNIPSKEVGEPVRMTAFPTEASGVEHCNAPPTPDVYLSE